MSETDVLFVTLDSCRYDTFFKLYSSGKLPNFSKVGDLHCAYSPSYFTYGSHAAFWMGFTPGVIGSKKPWLNPKLGKLFRMTYSGHPGQDTDESFHLTGSNIISGFSNLGYSTIGTGAVDWFNTSSETGSVLSSSFDKFYFPGNTWSLGLQLSWIQNALSSIPSNQPKFVFINVGETHVPYWHEGATWDRWPSPCIPFGGKDCSFELSSYRQSSCLQWVDYQFSELISQFSNSTILVCADHGDCWGEDGLWEHGISHPSTLTVPLLMRVRGRSVNNDRKPNFYNKLKNKISSFGF